MKAQRPEPPNAWRRSQEAAAVATRSTAASPKILGAWTPWPGEPKAPR